MKHEKTIANIKEIESTLRAIKAEQDKTNGKIKEIAANNIYSPAHKDALIHEEKQGFEVFAASKAAKLYECRTAILEAEAELMDAVIDVNDSTITNAVQLVNALGVSMPYDQQKGLAEQFRGNYPAEKCLAELYNKLGMSYTVQFTDFGRMGNNLSAALAAFTSEADKRASNYRAVENVCNTMLEAVQSDYRVDLGISDLAFMESVCAAAGVSMSGALGTF